MDGGGFSIDIDQQKAKMIKELLSCLEYAIVICDGEGIEIPKARKVVEKAKRLIGRSA